VWLPVQSALEAGRGKVLSTRTGTLTEDATLQNARYVQHFEQGVGWALQPDECRRVLRISSQLDFWLMSRYRIATPICQRPGRRAGRCIRKCFLRPERCRRS